MYGHALDACITFYTRHCYVYRLVREKYPCWQVEPGNSLTQSSLFFMASRHCAGYAIELEDLFVHINTACALEALRFLNILTGTSSILVRVSSAELEAERGDRLALPLYLPSICVFHTDGSFSWS